MSSPESALGFQTVDLLPTEKTAVREVEVILQRRYREMLLRPLDEADVDELMRQMQNWGLEAVRRYREIGFVVFTDPSNIEQALDGSIVFSPVVELTGRVEDTSFDFDRAQSEVQNGLADGVVGKINEKGEWSTELPTLF